MKTLILLYLFLHAITLIQGAKRPGPFPPPPPPPASSFRAKSTSTTLPTTLQNEEVDESTASGNMALLFNPTGESFQSLFHDALQKTRYAVALASDRADLRAQWDNYVKHQYWWIYYIITPLAILAISVFVGVKGWALFRICYVGKIKRVF